MTNKKMQDDQKDPISTAKALNLLSQIRSKGLDTTLELHVYHTNKGKTYESPLIDAGTVTSDMRLKNIEYQLRTVRNAKSAYTYQVDSTGLESHILDITFGTNGQAQTFKLIFKEPSVQNDTNGDTANAPKKPTLQSKAPAPEIYKIPTTNYTTLREINTAVSTQTYAPTPKQASYFTPRHMFSSKKMEFVEWVNKSKLESIANDLSHLPHTGKVYFEQREYDFSAIPLFTRMFGQKKSKHVRYELSDPSTIKQVIEPILGKRDWVYGFHVARTEKDGSQTHAIAMGTKHGRQITTWLHYYGIDTVTSFHDAIIFNIPRGTIARQEP